MKACLRALAPIARLAAWLAPALFDRRATPTPPTAPVAAAPMPCLSGLFGAAAPVAEPARTLPSPAAVLKQILEAEWTATRSSEPSPTPVPTTSSAARPSGNLAARMAVVAKLNRPERRASTPRSRTPAHGKRLPKWNPAAPKKSRDHVKPAAAILRTGTGAVLVGPSATIVDFPAHTPVRPADDGRQAA